MQIIISISPSKWQNSIKYDTTIKSQYIPDRLLQQIKNIQTQSLHLEFHSQNITSPQSTIHSFILSLQKSYQVIRQLSYNIQVILQQIKRQPAMEKRIFGRELDNLTNSNHIVLKSRSFSFENKSGNMGKSVNGAKGIQAYPNLVRRCSFATGLSKPSLTTQNRSHKDSDKSQVIRDKIETLEQKLKEFSSDPQLIAEYLIDNLATMTACEDHLYRIKSQNREKVDKIGKKRAKVIDWMVAVHYELKLFPQTLFIAVSYMDVYLSKVDVKEEQLQKVAITCMLMAGKYQETYRIPYIKNFLQLTKQSITKDEIKLTEQKVTSALDFNFITEVPLKYLDLYEKLVNMSQKNKFIAAYILELSLLDTSFFEFTPSLLAASVLYLVNKIRKIGPVWPKYLEQLTGLGEGDLRHCAKQLCTLLQKSSNQEHGQKIKKKYSTSEFCEASKIRLQRKSN